MGIGSDHEAQRQEGKRPRSSNLSGRLHPEERACLCVCVNLLAVGEDWEADPHLTAVRIKQRGGLELHCPAERCSMMISMILARMMVKHAKSAR